MWCEDHHMGLCVLQGKCHCMHYWHVINVIPASWYKAYICLQNSTGDAPIQSKQFQPKETLVFIRLVKWAMQALDIYTLSVTPVTPGTILPGGQRTQSSQTVRTKEEKEVLEHFAGVVSTLISLFTLKQMVLIVTVRL